MEVCEKLYISVFVFVFVLGTAVSAKVEKYVRNCRDRSVFVFISVFVFGKIRNSCKMEHDTAEIGESKIMKDIGKQ